MMQQAQIIFSQAVELCGVLDSKLWERKDASPHPLFDLRLRICYLDGGGHRAAEILGSQPVLIVATTIVLRAVAALREGLVAPNMPLLAGVASHFGLGVALARRSTARSSHCMFGMREDWFK